VGNDDENAEEGSDSSFLLDKGEEEEKTQLEKPTSE